MTSARPARCLIADDHPALVAALAEFLSNNGFEVVACAADGASALARAEETRPDIALVDYRMPWIEGAQLVARLKQVAPESRIAVYTAGDDERLVVDALRAGAEAIILKDAPLPELVRALGAILGGDRYVDPALARNAIDSSRRSLTSLSAREHDVLRLLADGLTQEEIGAQLSIGAETVRTHVRRACERLGAKTRTQAVATALRKGLLD
jgi:DNA-binding NarL/FixJ family response regulator